MKKDIENRDDIYKLVKHFYGKLMNDAEMHHFFLDFKKSELLETHLQTLVDFWDNILFYSGGYRKNAMQPHLNLHHKNPIAEKHFNSWLSMFNSSIDELFEGEVAWIAKNRAQKMSTMLYIHIYQHRIKGN